MADRPRDRGSWPAAKREVRGYSLVYVQQTIVNDGALALSRDFSLADIPLIVEPNLTALTATQVDELLRNCATALKQVEYVQALASTLPPDYKEVLGETSTTR